MRTALLWSRRCSRLLYAAVRLIAHLLTVDSLHIPTCTSNVSTFSLNFHRRSSSYQIAGMSFGFERNDVARNQHSKAGRVLKYPASANDGL